MRITPETARLISSMAIHTRSSVFIMSNQHLVAQNMHGSMRIDAKGQHGIVAWDLESSEPMEPMEPMECDDDPVEIPEKFSAAIQNLEISGCVFVTVGDVSSSKVGNFRLLGHDKACIATMRSGTIPCPPPFFEPEPVATFKGAFPRTVDKLYNVSWNGKHDAPLCIRRTTSKRGTEIPMQDMRASRTISGIVDKRPMVMITSLMSNMFRNSNRNVAVEARLTDRTLALEIEFPYRLPEILCGDEEDLMDSSSCLEDSESDEEDNGSDLASFVVSSDDSDTVHERQGTSEEEYKFSSDSEEDTEPSKRSGSEKETEFIDESASSSEEDADGDSSSEENNNEEGGDSDEEEEDGDSDEEEKEGGDSDEEEEEGGDSDDDEEEGSDSDDDDDEEEGDGECKNGDIISDMESIEWNPLDPERDDHRASTSERRKRRALDVGANSRKRQHSDPDDNVEERKNDVEVNMLVVTCITTMVS